MAQLDRMEIAKIAVAPLVTLLIAAVGWVLTNSYNATQLEISTRKNAADLEIAQINAALRYVESIRNIPKDELAQRRQAVAIAAPVLPPDLAFRLAVDQLPDDPITLSTLMSKYSGEAYDRLVPYLELPLGELKRVLEPSPESGPYAVQPTELERRAGELLHYLRARGLSQSLFDHLVSGSGVNNQFRASALLLYFAEYRRSLRGDAGYVVQQAYERVRVQDEFKSYMRDPSLSPQVRQAIATATSIVFGQRYQYQSDIFITETAKRFWEGVDVARGVTPVEGTVQSYVYEKVFHYNDPPGSSDWYRRDAVELASANLRDRLLRLQARNLNLDNIRLILYSYASSPTVGNESAYLIPADVVEVTRRVLDWADTPERRKALSMELGSLMGQTLLLKMLPSSIHKPSRYEDLRTKESQARCAAAKSFAEMLIDWYRKHYADDWHIPKFLGDVASEFPDLENKIDRTRWGLGAAGELGSSRGCR